VVGWVQWLDGYDGWMGTMVGRIRWLDGYNGWMGTMVRWVQWWYGWWDGCDGLTPDEASGSA
jgi:hypothetical protein